MSRDADYDLNVLLELRGRSRDHAQDQLAAELATLATREQEVAARRADLATAQQRRAQATARFDTQAAAAPLPAGAFIAMQDYVRGAKLQEQELHQAVERALRALTTQRTACKQAQAHLTTTVKDLEAVLAHQRQWREEQKVLEERKQSAAMDDVAARLWRDQQP